jgi:cephalosporin-C deacetylase
VNLSDRTPYTEITAYLSVHRAHAKAAFRTLSYLDGVSFARRATAPALFSVGLMDPICPPSTVYAAYNSYGARTGGVAKEIEVYEFTEHEGGGGHQFARQLPWLSALAGGSAETGTDGTIDPLADTLADALADALAHGGAR